ncbi:hypothetical protein JCM3775_000188 [Rhodotorula graminis]|uniref:Complex 1 LYR protein domain-containing protein n=1 Tax=Rhodotorula graminis (strain WP1) TaxID=578459 RepID=A0A194S6J2_RHOGW|nr:uncharacterized protein RHOBADRAFT_13079 [Rhodotorula graminis WP1]KPV76348.1 hypothetical protein RHOBADRAFT_13079 [Rhodotorula graminis WP1]
MSARARTLAALPRQLHISPATAISRTHLLALYKEQLRVAHSFGSYNFREYFIRRTRNKFRAELPALLDAAYASPSSTSSSASAPSTSSPPASTSSAPTTATEGDSPARAPEDRLREWYTESLGELAVMARAAIVNGMYEAPKLVIEGRGRAMAVGGGGAGAEASYGGGGQPADPAHPQTGTQ